MKDSIAAYIKRVKDLDEHVKKFAIAQHLLGPDRPIAYEDLVAYFKVHLPERTSWVICRFYFGSRHLFVSVPLPTERVQQLAPAFIVTLPEKGWAGMVLNAVSALEKLGDVLVAAYEQQRAMRLNIYN
jgi:predicted type IV restriction endonuclease